MKRVLIHTDPVVVPVSHGIELSYDTMRDFDLLYPHFLHEDVSMAETHWYFSYLARLSTRLYVLTDASYSPILHLRLHYFRYRYYPSPTATLPPHEVQL